MNMITNNRELKEALHGMKEGYTFLDGVSIDLSYVDSTELEQVITIEYCKDCVECHSYANAIYVGMNSILCDTSMEVIRDYNVKFSNFDEDTKWIRLAYKQNARD